MAAAKSSNRALYVISVAAELAGVHPQTLRIYERKGLLDPARTGGGSRRYSDQDIARLRRILDLTEAGLNLAGVKMVMELDEENHALREQRKLATVLFADVVGFTSRSETMDPEMVARTVDAAFRRMGEVVAEHGGTIDKYMGDSVMALFGVPQAHDDDAERAVAAGLAMRGLGGDLAFSIGVNTGEVMVTAVGGEAGTTVIGDTVNVAARLEKAAGPGEV